MKMEIPQANSGCCVATSFSRCMHAYIAGMGNLVKTICRLTNCLLQGLGRVLCNFCFSQKSRLKEGDLHPFSGILQKEAASSHQDGEGVPPGFEELDDALSSYHVSSRQPNDQPPLHSKKVTPKIAHEVTNSVSTLELIASTGLVGALLEQLD